MSDLLKINVNQHTEKKGNLTYLSWAWAWAEVLKIDPDAEWFPHEFGPEGSKLPYMMLHDTTALVKVTVTIRGKSKLAILPVMDHRNKAIQGPDAFQVNTATMRCLAKAISMHGLGLYIYAGEDLPPIDEEALRDFCGKLVALHEEGNNLEAVRMWYAERPDNSNEAVEFMWGQLRDYSELRSAIKANKPESK